MTDPSQIGRKPRPEPPKPAPTPLDDVLGCLALTEREALAILRGEQRP